MNQKKTGTFLRELRKEKGLTQEQFSEIVHVSSRTVSRWENGNNMPDLDVLIDISDYYEVELREILDGERKSGTMNKEIEDTVLKVADYANTESERINKRVRICNATAMFLMLLYSIVKDTGFYDNLTVKYSLDFAQGLAIGILLAGLLFSSKYGLKIRAFKQRVFSINQTKQ